MRHPLTSIQTTKILTTYRKFWNPQCTLHSWYNELEFPHQICGLSIVQLYKLVNIKIYSTVLNV